MGREQGSEEKSKRELRITATEHYPVVMMSLSSAENRAMRARCAQAFVHRSIAQFVILN